MAQFYTIDCEVNPAWRSLDHLSGDTRTRTEQTNLQSLSRVLSSLSSGLLTVGAVELLEWSGLTCHHSVHQAGGSTD